MHTDINSITRQYFHKETLENVSKDEIESFIIKYPYSAAARYLLAQKIYNGDNQKPSEALITAGLYFNNPLLLDWLLNNHKEPFLPQETAGTSGKMAGETATATADETVTEAPTAEAPTGEQAAAIPPVKLPAEEPATDSPIVFQSYHTIDYFASQGIRLDAADLTKDRLGQQLKSFTEWLKSMKKLPMSQVERPREYTDDASQQQVIANAAHSIEDKDIMTESMAEVWLKQGNKARAIDIYNKLSLLDPSKSAYFAAKIDQLK